MARRSGPSSAVNALIIVGASRSVGPVQRAAIAGLNRLGGSRGSRRPRLARRRCPAR